MEANEIKPSLTFADYESWDGDWELYDGVPVAMSPSPVRTHQRVVADLIWRFKTQLAENDGCHCEVAGELDWRIPPRTVLRPDVYVACPPKDTRWLDEAPQLVVEVLSPSTRFRDQNEKLAEYQKHGVRHYVMIDPEFDKTDALTLGADGLYHAAERDDRGFRFALHDGCELRLPHPADG